MIMSKPNIWIIDDCYCEEADNERKRVIKTLESSNKYSITASSPDEYQKFRNILAEKKDQTDLVLIDFKFDKGNRSFEVGSELASKVRHICYDTPVYLLSAHIQKNRQYGRVQGFERTLGDEFISKLPLVEAEVAAFRSIKDAINSKDSDAVVSLLGCPDGIAEDVFASLPPSVIKPLFEKNKSSRVDSDPILESVSIGPRVELFRWFIDRFYRYPGFLMDDVACSQMLGITKEYFDSNVSNVLEACRYKGVFGEGFKPRYWKVLVEDHLIELDKENIIDGRRPLSESYSTVLEANDQQKARCVICNTLWPDALAQDPRDPNSDCYPVHIRCAEEDVDTTIGPYFTKPRVLPE